MEKLVELLNEYGNEICNHWGDYPTDMDEFTDRDTYWYLSKKFWFIKWLVYNDKIDRDEIIINSDFMPVAFDRKWEKYEWSEEKQLLMLLSIRDEPINFLISILK